MEILKNARRSLLDVSEVILQAERLSQSMAEKAASLERRNMELQTALCRCRDMIESLRNATSPNELRDEAAVYLSILEGMIADKVIQPYPHYSTAISLWSRNHER